MRETTELGLAADERGLSSFETETAVLTDAGLLSFGTATGGRAAAGSITARDAAAGMSGTLVWLQIVHTKGKKESVTRNRNSPILAVRAGRIQGKEGAEKRCLGEPATSVPSAPYPPRPCIDFLSHSLQNAAHELSLPAGRQALSEPMKTALELTIALSNNPGSLARMSDMLRAADVNIEALFCNEGDSKTMVHIVVDDPETAKVVLGALDDVEATEVLAIPITNKPGSIAQIARRCAGAGINIKHIYATSFGKDAMVYLAVEDLAAAMKVLK